MSLDCPFCGHVLTRDAALRMAVCDNCGACKHVDKATGIDEEWQSPGEYWKWNPEYAANH